jgi:hypothetical protein
LWQIARTWRSIARELRYNCLAMAGGAALGDERQDVALARHAGEAGHIVAHQAAS